jgi:hypothetical protein
VHLASGRKLDVDAMGDNRVNKGASWLTDAFGDVTADPELDQVL